MDVAAPTLVAPAEGVGIGTQFALPVERARELRRAVETVLDPFGVVAPIVHAQFAWWAHPLELGELATRYTADLVALAMQVAAKLAGREVADVVQPQPDDARFRDAVWTREPLWDALKQVYLFHTRHVQDALFQTPGLSAKERRRAAFWWRQWLNAVAPTNFLASNPVAMRKAVESRGESLRRGFEIFLQDLQAGTIRMTGEKDFVVGGNLATTPGAVVFRNRLLELIHYAPTQAEVRPVPIVIVTPCINKFYVLDLDAEKSLVKYLLDRGFDVYITSWKNPGADLRDIGFDDYVAEGVAEAVRLARELSGALKVHAVGYCIGGTLLAAYMAWASKRLGREAVPVAHWTLLCALVDFQSPGDIEVFIDEGSVAWLIDAMRARGYLDGSAMATTFRLLRSNSLVWHYLVHGWLYGEPPPPSDVLYWNMDCTRLPARMHEFYLRELYLKNRLVKPNALAIGGVPIDLAAVHVPLYQVSAEDDHITPWRQTFRINGQVTGEKRFVLTSSGHILGIVNPPQAPAHRSFRVGRAHRGESAEAWLASAEPRPGSWWEDWTDWLAGRCGAPRPAPPVWDAAHPKLADAPGSYVLER
ncbi:MAG TPA: alpha/beta fold hydrolase [Burkholderiales bacterium]|nr:alpha/beta fold hydrolase [Burkholderiales bacterium]